MSIHYMDEGFGPYADRGFDAASAHLERNGLHLAPGRDTEQHSRDIVKHTLSLEPERVPAITAELFAEAIAIAGAAREAHGKGPVNANRAQSYWESLKELIDSIHDH
jgi:hypothetical protein